MGNQILDSVELYKKGKRIDEDIEKYSQEAVNASGEEKDNLNQKISALKEEKTKLKDEIYAVAKEKSGLDYGKDDKNPELLRKKYNEEIENLKKRKQELRLEKIRIEKLREEKSVQIKQQFEMACEKYKAMLDMKKITPEMYEARIENMKIAKLNDRLDFTDKLYNIKEEANKIEENIEGIKEKISEVNQKEIIYNEYGDVYYRLFGEVLADRNKADKKIEKSENPKLNEDDEKSKSKTENNVSFKENVQPVNTQPEIQKPEENKEEKNVTVTSKTVFDELYGKMRKGIITDKELNALSEVLVNSDNYDKYGITTGLIFNKAKKILKYQGARTASNIENFLRECGNFSDSIKFSADIEKDNILSHDILKSWKNIDEKLTYTDATFSVEKYIAEIEKYKEDGNVLTGEQEEILKKARDIQKNLDVYRKAININEEVAMDRDTKSHNSIFYLAFKNKFKSEKAKALPEKRNENVGYISMDKLDLSSMVNTEPTKSDVETSKPDVNKDKNRDIVK